MNVSTLPTERQQSEGHLIDRTLRGGTEAFGDLITPYLPSLSRFARMRLRNDAEVEDVVQQAILRAFMCLRQFRGEASFKTWLCAIAFNEVKHLRRRQALVRTWSLPRTLPKEMVDPDRSPEMQFQHSQEIERVRQKVGLLPEKYRLMIEMRDFQGLSINETAHLLSISVAAAKTRHFRAREVLMRSLIEQDKPSGSGEYPKRFSRGSLRTRRDRR